MGKRIEKTAGEAYNLLLRSIPADVMVTLEREAQEQSRAASVQAVQILKTWAVKMEKIKANQKPQPNPLAEEYMKYLSLLLLCSCASPRLAPPDSIVLCIEQGDT